MKIILRSLIALLTVTTMQCAEVVNRPAIKPLKLVGHLGEITSASFSPNNKLAVTSGRDKTVKIWDAQTGKLLRTFDSFAMAVNSAQFSHDGKRILTASDDGTVIIWDVRTGKLEQDLQGFTSGANSAAFSPNGNLAAACGADGKMTIVKIIKIWNLKTSTALPFQIGKSGVNAVAFSPDGQLLVAALSNGSMNMYDVTTGQEKKTFQGNLGPVLYAAFSPDGTLIASAGEDKTIRVWEVSTGNELLKLLGHNRRVTSVAFSLDGQRIISASDDKTAKIWDSQTGQLQLSLNFSVPVKSAAFSSDAQKIIAAGDNGMAKILNIGKISTAEKNYPISVTKPSKTPKSVTEKRAVKPKLKVVGKNVTSPVPAFTFSEIAPVLTGEPEEVIEPEAPFQALAAEPIAPEADRPTTPAQEENFDITQFLEESE